MDVLLESTGGDIQAAYKLIVHLRQHCKKLRVFVPYFAKSAATFFALGADEIWLHPDAELGPLDAQIADPRHPDRSISALEQFRALDYLSQHGYEILDQFVASVVKRTNMNIEDILSHAVDYTTNMMQGLYSNLDPIDFGTAHRALSISEEYGRRVMRRYGYKNLTTEKINDIVQALTWDYPTHSFVIDYPEAKNLGLKVNLMNTAMKEGSRTLSNSIREAFGFFGKKEQNADEEVAPSDESPPAGGSTASIVGNGRSPRRKSRARP